MDYEKMKQEAEQQGIKNLSIKEYHKNKNYTARTAFHRIRNSRKGIFTKVKNITPKKPRAKREEITIQTKKKNDPCPLPPTIKKACLEIWNCGKCWAEEENVTLCIGNYRLRTDK